MGSLHQHFHEVIDAKDAERTGDRTAARGDGEGHRHARDRGPHDLTGPSGARRGPR